MQEEEDDEADDHGDRRHHEGHKRNTLHHGFGHHLDRCAVTDRCQTETDDGALEHLADVRAPLDRAHDECLGAFALLVFLIGNGVRHARELDGHHHVAAEEADDDRNREDQRRRRRTEVAENHRDDYDGDARQVGDAVAELAGNRLAAERADQARSVSQRKAAGVEHGLIEHHGAVVHGHGSEQHRPYGTSDLADEQAQRRQIRKEVLEALPDGHLLDIARNLLGLPTCLLGLGALAAVLLGRIHALEHLEQIDVCEHENDAPDKRRDGIADYRIGARVGSNIAAGKEDDHGQRDRSEQELDDQVALSLAGRHQRSVGFGPRCDRDHRRCRNHEQVDEELADNVAAADQYGLGHTAGLDTDPSPIGPGAHDEDQSANGRKQHVGAVLAPAQPHALDDNGGDEHDDPRHEARYGSHGAHQCRIHAHRVRKEVVPIRTQHLIPPGEEHHAKAVHKPHFLRYGVRDLPYSTSLRFGSGNRRIGHVLTPFPPRTQRCDAFDVNCILDAHSPRGANHLPF